LVNTAERARDRLDDRSAVKREVRQQVRVGSRKRDVVCPSPRFRAADSAPVFAKVSLAPPATTTDATMERRVDRHHVAKLDAKGFPADGDYITPWFVTRYERVRHRR
jgi:hypothetical protein